MGLHNALTRATALASGLSRVMGLLADEEGVSRLGETLQPSWDPWGRWKPEYDLPRGEIPLWRGQGDAAPGAGNYMKHQLRMADGSNRIGVVEGVWVRTDVAPPNAIFNIRLHGTAFATLVGGLYNRDMRASTPTGLLELRTNGDNTNPGTQVGSVINSVTNAFTFFPLNVILIRGFGLYIAAPVNAALTTLWLAYEREALPGEFLR